MLDEKDQLEWGMWKPFFTDSQAWTTYLWPGLQNTLKAAALAMVIALPLGALSRHRPALRPPVGAGPGRRRGGVLPRHPGAAADDVRQRGCTSEYTDVSSDDRPLYAVVTGLVLYNASVLAEIVRAGILSLPEGQSEAAKAIGMRKGQTMRYVLLPQAVTAMLPAIVSQLVVIVKDTALGGAMLGFTELLGARPHDDARTTAQHHRQLHRGRADLHRAQLRCSPRFASWLEGRLRRGKKSTGAVLGADDGGRAQRAEVSTGTTAEGR